MQCAWSASRTCMEFSSASEYTATEPTPKRLTVRRMRQAMAPRLAIRIFLNIAHFRARSSRPLWNCATGRPAGGTAHSRGVPGHDSNRSRIVRIAGVVELRTVGNQHQRVHERGHLHVSAGGRDSIGESQLAFGRHGHVHEEIDVRGQVAFGHPAIVVRERQQEAVAAAMHRTLLERITHGIAFGGTRAAQRVVPPAGVVFDAQHRVAAIREKDGARSQIDALLRLDRVLRAVGFRGISGVVEQCVDGLVAFEIDDAKRLPAPHHTHPRFAGRHHFIDDVGRTHAVYNLSVLMKPRSFSGQRVRHRSSAAGGDPCRACSRMPAGAYRPVANGCGPACSTTIVSISKRRSTYCPALLWPEARCIDPASSTTTLLKKLMFATRSRSPRPYLPSSTNMASCPLTWRALRSFWKLVAP